MGPVNKMRASPIACKRCLRSLARQRRSRVRTADGIEAGSLDQSGSSLATETRISPPESPVNARCPVSIS